MSDKELLQFPTYNGKKLAYLHEESLVSLKRAHHAIRETISQMSKTHTKGYRSCLSDAFKDQLIEKASHYLVYIDNLIENYGPTDKINDDPKRNRSNRPHRWGS